MHDSPEPSEILAVASDLVRNSLAPVLPPDLSFNARVLANALDLVARQIMEDERLASQSRAKLRTLLKREGSENTLLAELSRRIEAGEIDLQNTALMDYLWTSTLAKLAVDQPKYASYLAESAKQVRQPDAR